MRVIGRHHTPRRMTCLLVSECCFYQIDWTMWQTCTRGKHHGGQRMLANTRHSLVASPAHAAQVHEYDSLLAVWWLTRFLRTSLPFPFFNSNLHHRRFSFRHQLDNLQGVSLLSTTNELVHTGTHLGVMPVEVHDCLMAHPFPPHGSPFPVLRRSNPNLHHKRFIFRYPWQQTRDCSRGVPMSYSGLLLECFPRPPNF